MWKKTLMAGTVAVALLGGTALAVASTGPVSDPVSPQVPAATQGQGSQDHWSEMSDLLGDEFDGMVEHMREELGGEFDGMVDLMESGDFDTMWDQMGEFMGEEFMGEDFEDFMGGTDMEEFMGEDFDEFMGGTDMEDFMGGSHMGGSSGGARDAGARFSGGGWDA